jgi:glutamate-1-semialdehyde 2,1-aminomutase
MKTERSKELFKRAIEVIPGGVNSPVRAFGPVGGDPIFIEKAKGQYLYDADGNQYIDYIGSWGPMILGHNDDRVLDAIREQLSKGVSYGAATELEVDMAELMCSLVPSLEMVRMVNSGTEAVMSAIRTARGFTGRNKIIKFEGCYHGHSDGLLVKAGSGVMTSGVPSSAGITPNCVMDTLSAVYNDLESVKKLFEENPGEIACIVVEPVAANMGVVLPEEGFLLGLRELCDQEGALLIFDEVITGFRLSLGGASEYFQIKPDLLTYGKIIGGGMPVGAYGGRKEIMQVVAPAGPVYQAGTLSGNPVAMTAGITQLQILRDHPEIYTELNRLGERFRTGAKAAAEEAGISCQITGIGSLSCLYFADQPVRDYASANRSDTAKFAEYYHKMLERGNYFGPSQFESVFLSAAHTEADIDQTIEDMKRAFR